MTDQCLSADAFGISNRRASVNANQMTYSRKLTVLSKNGQGEFTEFYEQPLIDRVKYLAFHNVLEALLYSRFVKPLTLAYEKRDKRVNRKADDDWFMPFTNRLDCICFDLNYKNNTILRP